MQAASRPRRAASSEAFNAALGLGAAQAVATDRQTNVASKPPAPGDHPDGRDRNRPPALYKPNHHCQKPPRTGAGRRKNMKSSSSVVLGGAGLPASARSAGLTASGIADAVLDRGNGRIEAAAEAGVGNTVVRRAVSPET